MTLQTEHKNTYPSVIDYGYLGEGPKFHFRDKGEFLPAAYAMAWCMEATGFYRIFTREDMKEFLFRLAIALHTMKLPENWLIRHDLVNYRLKGTYHLLTINDVAQHFGLQLFDKPENCMPRGEFLEDAGKHLNHAVFLGFLWNLSIIPTTRAEENDEDIDEVYSSEGYTPELTPDLIAKAEFIASDLMRFIPPDTFEKRPVEMIEKEKELEERKQRISSLPEFDIRKIPPDTVRRCLEIMYRDDLWLNVDDDPEELYEFGRPMIYLAWLWANGFMISDGIEAVPAEGFYLDFEDYEHFEDPGINLLATYEIYHLAEAMPLLKGLLTG